MTSNGQLASSELTPVQGSIQLANDTATDFLAMVAIAKQSGINVGIARPAGGYRDLATQRDMITHPANYNINPGIKLAPAGNSTHGFGECVDIVPITAKNWVEANGARFGFSRRAANDPNCFKHAPGIHYAPEPEPNQRKVKPVEARLRTAASVLSNYTPSENLKGNTIVTPEGYVVSPLGGGVYNGSNIWLVINGKFMHSSAVTNDSTNGLVDVTQNYYKTVEPEIVVPPEPQPELEIEEPEIVVPPVIGTEGANVPPILTGAGDTSNVIVTPVTPTPTPVITNPILIPDVSTLDKLTTALANVMFLTLPKTVRKKVYDYTSKLALIVTALGVLGMSTAGVIGGEVGSKIAVGSGILTLVSTAMSGLATKLAEKNT